LSRIPSPVVRIAINAKGATVERKVKEKERERETERERKKETTAQRIIDDTPTGPLTLRLVRSVCAASLSLIFEKHDKPSTGYLADAVRKRDEICREKSEHSRTDSIVRSVTDTATLIRKEGNPATN